MEKNKPTPEKINAAEWFNDNYFDSETGDYLKWKLHIVMQEFAEAYHKERLRGELIAYDEYLDEYIDHKRSELRVNTYLKSKIFQTSPTVLDQQEIVNRCRNCPFKDIEVKKHYCYGCCIGITD